MICSFTSICVLKQNFLKLIPWLLFYLPVPILFFTIENKALSHRTIKYFLFQFDHPSPKALRYGTTYFHFQLLQSIYKWKSERAKTQNLHWNRFFPSRHLPLPLNKFGSITWIDDRILILIELRNFSHILPPPMSYHANANQKFQSRPYLT